MSIELPPYSAATAHPRTGLFAEPETQHTLTLGRSASQGGQVKATLPQAARDWPMHLRMPDGVRGPTLTYTHAVQPRTVLSKNADSD